MNKIASSRLILFASLLSLIFIFSCSSSRQISSTTTPLQLTQAINNDQWIFSADYALPAYGRSRNLTGSNFVKCNKHELTVALPYFGQQTSPSGSYGGNPLDFYSTDFKFSKENMQNRSWSVTIESPNPEVRSMVFSFYDNGTAQLSVVMTNRSAISFNGKVMPLQS